MNKFVSQLFAYVFVVTDGFTMVKKDDGIFFGPKEIVIKKFSVNINTAEKMRQNKMQRKAKQSKEIMWIENVWFPLLSIPKMLQRVQSEK